MVSEPVMRHKARRGWGLWGKWSSHILNAYNVPGTVLDTWKYRHEDNVPALKVRSF